MSIFVCESAIGDHASLCREIGSRLIAFSYWPRFPSLSRTVKKVALHTNIQPSATRSALYIDGVENAAAYLWDEFGGDIVGVIAEFHRKDNFDNIYLGHDLDFGGQVMSSVLFYHLVERGIDPDKIFRVPLLADGGKHVHLAFGEFYPEEQMLCVLNSIREEQKWMHSYPKTKVGCRRMAALDLVEKLRKRAGGRIVRKNSGTNFEVLISFLKH